MASSLASGPTAPLGPCSALRSQLRSSVVARSVAAPPRPTQQRQAAVAHPELLSPTSSQRGYNFDEYIQHTQMMDRLADRQSELANVLVQLTELDEQLPDLDPPSPTPDDKSEVEARRAKRAAQRAERKAAMQAAAAGAASTSHSTSATPFLNSASHHAESLVHADASSSSSSSSSSSAWSAAHAPSRSGMEPAGSHARASSPALTQQADVLQLEELFKLTMDDDQEPPQQQPQQPTSSRRLAPASNPHAATSRSSFAAPATPSTSSASAGGVLVPRKTTRRRATVTAPAPAAAPAVEPTAASTAAAPALPTILRPASSRSTTSPPEPALKQSQHATPSPPEDGLFDILQIVSTPPASASAALAPAPQAASPQTLTPRRRRATSEPVPQPRQELQPASQQQEQQQEPPQPQQRVSRSSTATVVVEEDEEEQEFAGPSEEDLAALERALAASSDEENEDEAERNPRASSSTSSLEASALVGRHQEPGQLGVGQLLAGPSLLSLVPAHAAPGRGARARQVRRKSRQGHAAAVAVAAPTRGSKSGSGSYGRGDSTSVFLATSSNHAFLDTDIEKEVTEMTRDLLFLDKVKKQCAKTLQRPPTTQEVAMALGMDEHSYQARYAAGLKAKEMLLKSNYRLVMAVCKKYIGNAGNGLQMQDLVSEGVKGLLRSVEKYDASKGFRFGTYAHWWIRQAVSRSLQETGRAVRLPVHMIEQITKMRAASQAISMRLGREATTAELAEALELPPSRIDALIAASRAASSLDTPVMGNDSGATAKDVVEDDSADADEEFGLSSLKHDIEDMIGELPEREATVVRLRFGLEDGEEWTLEDIGERLGVTRERIRQIEAKALQRLKVRTVESSGKLREYSDNLDMMESREVAARTSSGTKKT